MRILFVLHTYPPESWGGTELHVRGIARCLVKSGHEVMVFCREADQDRPDGSMRCENLDDVNVVRFNNIFSTAQGFEAVYLNPSAHEAFEGILDGFQPDVVHVHHLIGLSTTLLADCKRRKLPLVYSLHDFWVACPRGQRLTPELHLCETIDRNKCFTCLSGLWPDWFSDRMSARNVEVGNGRLEPEVLVDWDIHMAQALEMPDLILTPSAFHRRKMVELGLEGDRIVALPHGLDHSRIRPKPSARGKVKNIGFIGAVIPTKGVHILMEAFAQLDRTDVELHIWGDAPDFHEQHHYMENLKALALGARGKVRIFGKYTHEDVGAILQTLDILVVPSVWWETFSLTLREGMLAGLPVVASDIGAMREALEFHDAGILFEAGNATDLADSLESLIQNSSLRDRFSRARDTVKRIEQNAEEYVGIYDKARDLAQKRDDALVVPEEEHDAGSLPAHTKQALPPSISTSSMDLGDMYFELKQTGGGAVSLSSAVDRSDGTSVCFRIAQGDQELQLTVRVPQPGGGDQASPQPRSIEAAPETSDSHEQSQAELISETETPGTSEVDRSADGMLLSQSSTHEKGEQQKAMFSLNPEVFIDHVKALDEMVEISQLETEQEKRPTASDAEKPRRKRRRKKQREPEIVEAEVLDVSVPEAAPEPKPKPAQQAAPHPERSPTPPPQPSAEPSAEPSAQPWMADEDGIVFESKGSWSIPKSTGSSKAKPKPKSKRSRSGPQPVLKQPKPGSFGDGL